MCVTVLFGNGTKFKVRIWPWPTDPKINRGSPWVMIDSHGKYHHCMSKDNAVIVRKRCKLQSTNLALTFNLFTQTTIWLFLQSWAIHVWSIIIVGQKAMEYRAETIFPETDGQTAMVKPVYRHPPPPQLTTSLAEGIINTLNSLIKRLHNLYLLLGSWPLTSTINRVHPLIILATFVQSLIKKNTRKKYCPLCASRP